MAKEKDVKQILSKYAKKLNKDMYEIKKQETYRIKITKYNIEVYKLTNKKRRILVDLFSLCNDFEIRDFISKYLNKLKKG